MSVVFLFEVMKMNAGDGCTVHTVYVVLKERTLKQFAILFSSGPGFVRTLHHGPSILDGPVEHGS